ncbi:MAG: type 1 glutamine amidotransferase [Rhodospirillales bacterium]|nr:type 1 glutamine amidotransferase [Rhodospirillales bacterium]
MPHILIADCVRAAHQRPFDEIGARGNVALFTEALRHHDAAVECSGVNLADGEALPAGTGLVDFDGVILTGSPLHVGDASPEVLHQLAFARAAFATAIPVWGSCWGLQLAAAALGGKVRHSPAGREIGVARAITINAAGREHPLLAGRAAVFDALCSHLDEVETPPPGAVVLASNAISTVQAMVAPTPGGGVFWGTQYHPEMDLTVVAALLELRAEPITREGFAESRAALLAYAADCRALDAAPGRRDLAWRTGIGPDITDPLRRTRELGNWLRHIVLPYRAGRGNRSR